MKKSFIFLIVACFFLSGHAQNEITHGPILGHITDESVRIWARTSKSAQFYIEYMPLATDAEIEAVDWSRAMRSRAIPTLLENDNTGWTTLSGLTSEKKYIFRVLTENGKNKPHGSFKTLPKASAYENEYNPKGLFNFSFEFGSCASQNPKNGLGPSLPTYTTMLREVKDGVQFAIMNGDWLYEDKRDYPVAEWQRVNGVSNQQKPDIVNYAPTITGVWENYKSYLSAADNLAEWHRNMPSYFTFDDHELINDIWGAGSMGHRNRRTVFRDIGVAAWYDYLGWADPVTFKQDVHFGKAKFKKGSSILRDSKADFSALNLKEMANLHVHWGTLTAGVDDTKYDVDEEGDPNSKVYSIEKVRSENSLEISPKAVATGMQSYSIGRQSYSKFTVGNCDYFLLDTKTNREYHDTSNRDKAGLSLLGKQQYDWLVDAMKKSEADFLFVFSSVPFMIPHVGASGYAMADNKDESWTVFIDEREKLIQIWEDLDKPVFVLTGDLHNSFAVKITDQIWEFCSGPHNSVNHRLSDEGGRPNSGLFQFDKRQMDIRWSSFVMDDIPRSERMFPHYCVVQVNNVFNNPIKRGDKRWVAYQHPQVIFKFYDGYTGELRYAETVSTKR